MGGDHYRCSLPCCGPQQAAESWVLLCKADLKKDGLEEAIYLDESERDNGFVTLHILDDNGKEIWSVDASTSHVGWNSLFFERYSWSDETPVLYADGDDLKTRLIKFSENVVSNHR